jgi:putative transposase
MFKSYKFRLSPTKEQEKTFIEWQGQLRFVWNQFLSLNIKKYETEKKFIFKYDLKKLLPGMKKQYNWLNAPGQSLQQIAFQLDKALKNCYKSKMGFPYFKKKGFEAGIYIPQNNLGKQIGIGPKFIKIPKLGEIKWIRHREMQGQLKSITITRDVDQWYISCLCKSDYIPVIKEITSIENDITGIDLGIKEFIVDSNAVIYESPNFLKKSEKKLIRKQRQYSTKKKGSNNQWKAKLKLARLYRKVRFQRKDFLHKLSYQLANENSVVICEDLAIKNMMENHCLAKVISDQGWSQFIGYLEYKLNWTGGQLVKINRFAPSSQICSGCGYKQKMPLSERTYNCPSCGLSIDRDLNAARNIKAFGVKLLKNTAGIAEINACGDTTNGDLTYDKSSYVSMKQEATSTLVVR